MKPLWVKLMCCSLVALFSAAEPASAAWNNVFQVTCLFRNRRTVTRYYAPAPAVAYSSPVVVTQQAYSSPCCTPCPQTQCTTNYVQRCYYQPVTTYQTRTYYEPVTTYRTSYYYQPVTSYTYSCYYDPCTCSYQQVAVPCTSYQLRAQSCPVKSWVQRCCTVPVTSYRRCCYWQPQTTCCTTSVGAPVPCPPSNGSQPIVQQQQPIAQQPAPNGNPPSVGESHTPNGGQPPLQQQAPPQQYNRYYRPPQGSQSKQTNPAPSNRQPSFGNSGSSNNAPNSSPPPKVRLNRIVSNSSTWVSGQVVKDNSKPRSGASLLFVNLDHRSSKQAATTNGSGQFNVSLPSGRWAVYMRQPNGQRVYHSRIDVSDQKMPYITLVSR